MPECAGCGDDIAEDEAVYGQSGVDEEELADVFESGESKPLDDVIEFDDGPYCGFDCMMGGDA